ncbi:MAG: DEAD/DEAH box helicase [Gammaproteobacteria bacterium]|nr:DEAD/DEAH box helicase [Gammaproteobacteria bacterium]
MKKPAKKLSTASRRRAAKPSAEPRLSRQRKPEGLSAEDWQRRLRQQFGREQSFTLENLGDDPVFSEFAVINPESGRRYRVAIRGEQPGENYCSCPDFATNDLGTCKHIEFTLARIAAKRGGKTALKRGFHPPFSELFLDYAGRRRVRLRLGSACPRGIRKKASALFAEHDGWQLFPERYSELPAFLEAVRKTGHDLRCYDDAQAFIAEHRDAETRRRILDEAYPKGAKSPALKKLLKVGLYAYQAEGALFAARAGRALIGDEMGLGKTVQAIAAIELLARHFGAGRVLIVCPTSLKYQWQREIDRFSGRDAMVIGGLRAMRQTLYGQESFCKITNYETLTRDLDLIQSWAPDVVIVDEAQRIKNWSTVAARALKRIDSPYAIVLTGTPLENRLEELISIVQFVDQHRLGPTWRLLHEHQQRDDHGRVIGYKNLDKIGKTLSPVMLRRRKAEVLDQLPARVDNTLFVPMTPQQAGHHEENREIVARIVLRWRKTGYLSEQDQIRLTCCLQNMRMSCNSTYLLDHETDHGYKADELIALLEDMFEDPQAKVVVFSQWLRTHELIVRRLEMRGWGHVLFHGGVPGEKRGALVDRFLADPDCRLFLSTDAGGVGLNLQHAAAIVVNMDMPWNPAVLEQRIGRVHRLGQARGVQVVNFVAKGTIEEGMLSVLAFKKSLFAGVLDGGQSEVTLQGTRLSKFMESVEQVTSAAGAIEAETVTEAADQPLAGHTQAAEAPHPSADPWAPLLEAGIRLLGELAAASTGDAQSRWVETDPNTGRRYLKLPVPEPQAVQRLADSLVNLLNGQR